MVLGSHVVFGTYGFWLPNDPRGSWSDFVGAWELFRFGRATKTDSRVSVAAVAHDQEKRLAAKQALKRPVVHFTGLQARAVGAGFAECAERSRLSVWACSIRPEHVHLVLARHVSRVEMLVNWLKGAATRALVAEELHPFGAVEKSREALPHCWARGHWKVFLSTPEHIAHAIEYVEQNPVKEGKPRQRWTFVRPFEQFIF